MEVHLLEQEVPVLLGPVTPALGTAVRDTAPGSAGTARAAGQHKPLKCHPEDSGEALTAQH